MATIDAEGYWIDPRGKKWPKKAVKELDRRRDKLVEDAHKGARKLQKALADFNQTTRRAIQAHLEWAAEHADVTANPGGNYTFTGFSGLLKVQLKVQEYMTFDEQLVMAKELIDQFLLDEAKGSSTAIVTLVQDVFQVDKAGRINAQRVLSLRKHAFKDARWRKAMDLISESVNTQTAKAYLMLQARESVEHDWRTLRLDLSTLAPEVTK